MTTAESIAVFGANGSGGRNVGVTLGDLSATIFSRGPEQDAAAQDLAATIVDAKAMLDREAVAAREHAREMNRARATMRQLQVERDAAREALARAAEGRRAFFGPVLCVPATENEGWSGPVWLLDPEKEGRGRGLYFESLAEVRASHPELWVIGMTDIGVLLDAAVLPTATIGGVL